MAVPGIRQRITLIEHMFRWAAVCALTFVEYYLANSFIANSLTHIFLPNGFRPKSSSAKLDVSVSAEEKSRCIASICSYLDNFFKSSIVGTPSSGRINNSSSFNSSGRSGSKDTSLSSLASLVGYHDSPSNRSITSIYTRQQLQELISRDNSVIDSFSNGSLFINAKKDDDRQYQAGIPFSLTNSEQAATQAKCLFTSLETSPKGSNKLSDDFRRSFSEYQSKYFSSGGGGSVGHFIARQETDLHKILKNLDAEHNNISPKREIEEMNELLANKFTGAHLKIGASSVDTFMAAFATKAELRNTLIPFILPYLRIHSNQNYLVKE
uniref:Uncharacterized protein n=1 Tax=Ditylenchus dipsaci TaxID=166011 RepID=A0A915DBZ2_9BILA